jgi:hypothetical protein
VNRYDYIEIFDDAAVTEATVMVVSAFAMVPSSWGNAGVTPKKCLYVSPNVQTYINKLTKGQ